MADVLELEDVGMLVVGELGPEVDLPRRPGNLDDRLRRTMDEPRIISRLTTMFGQNKPLR